MRAELFTVASRGPGKLSTMARPRGGEWLRDEMAALHEAGAEILVSMLAPSEAQELGLAGEAEAAEAAGISFTALPVPDRGTPAVAAFCALARRLADELGSGKHIVVHCRMGIGRSSMLAVAVLMARGSREDEAWVAVGKARGLDVPDTPQQKRWVHNAMDGEIP